MPILLLGLLLRRVRDAVRDQRPSRALPSGWVEGFLEDLLHAHLHVGLRFAAVEFPVERLTHRTLEIGPGPTIELGLPPGPARRVPGAGRNA